MDAKLDAVAQALKKIEVLRPLLMQQLDALGEALDQISDATETASSKDECTCRKKSKTAAEDYLLQWKNTLDHWGTAMADTQEGLVELDVSSELAQIEHLKN